MQKSGNPRSLVLAAACTAALSAMLLNSAPAVAQQRVGGDGRALDASNRVGSGGLNDNSASALPPGVFNNQLVNGTVTGGVQFRGNVGYFAPGQFEANLPGRIVDNFTAQSTNVTTGGTIINNAQNVHLFLGDSRGINPPSNFVSTGAQPGYIPSAVASDTALSTDARLGIPPSSSSVGSLVPSAIFQTGGTQGGGPVSTYQSASPLFGITSLQSQQQVSGTSQFNNAALGNAAQQTAIGTGDRVDVSSSIQNPALGANAGLSADNSGGSSGLGTPPGIASFATPGAQPGFNQAGAAGPNGANTRLSGARGTQNGAAAANSQAGAQNPNGNPNSASLSGAPLGASVNASQGGSQIGALGGPGGANPTAPGAIPSAYPIDARVGGSAIGGDLSTGQGGFTNVYSPSSNLPGSAYQRMLLRLKTINPNAPLNTTQLSLLNQAKLRDIRLAQQNAASGKQRAAGPDTGGRGAHLNTELSPPGSGAGSSGLGPNGLTPNGAPASGAPGSMEPGKTGVGPGGVGPAGNGLHSGPVLPGQVSTGGEKDRPVLLNSFAVDAATPATRDELKQADQLMHEGKFTAALEQFDLVEQQTPANPFIQLARANAELGASYYGLAVAHLQQAFLGDQALLSAQLDLHSILGEDKVQYLVKDLKQIAQANPSESRPVFLLAYICYNTDNPRGAAAYLDLAEKREGKPDPFFRLLRQHWDLPDITGEPNDSGLNK
jgi:hypothetical protein